jgi:hypothetical protein
MDTDTPQPRETKRWLVDDGLVVVTTKYRRELARELLLGDRALPPDWLTTRQQDFFALHPDVPLNAGTRRAGTELLGPVIHLCDRLIPWLVDDYFQRHTIEPDARKRLRPRAPALVRDVLMRTCPSWPSPDLNWLATVRPAIDEALSSGRALPASSAGDRATLVRPDQRPVDRRDFEEKLIVHTAGDRARSRRANRTLWHQEFRRAFRVAVALVAAAAIAVLYLILFAAIRYVQPNLSVREAMVVVGAAIGAALGGTGLGLLGQAISARRSRVPPEAEAPAAARSDGEDRVQPGNR